MAKMTLEQYIKNPMGKNNAVMSGPLRETIKKVIKHVRYVNQYMILSPMDVPKDEYDCGNKLAFWYDESEWLERCNYDILQNEK